VPECYIDTMLVHTLMPPGKNERYNHQHGCFDVSNEMEMLGLKDRFAVGIIDNDKKQAKYLRSFTELANIKNDLKLYKHKVYHQYFIEINPAIELWIFKICEQEKIDITEFDLPKDLKTFKKITKSQSSISDRRFIELFLRFKTSNNELVLNLMRWINFLRMKNYQTDINELING